MPTMQNAHAALRLLRKLNASGGVSRIPRCRAHVLGFHHAAFSGSCEDDLPKMNPFAENLPASSIVEDTLAQGKSKIFESNNIEDIPQLPAERLNRLENILEQHGRSLVSLASQLEEQKQLFATILQDIELLKCSCTNRQSSQRIEKSASDIDNMMQKSSTVSTNRIDTKVCEKTKEKIVSASKKSMEMPVLDNDRKAATTEGLLEQGLANRLLAAQEQEGLQKCILSEEDEKDLGQAGLIDVSDADEDSDIFDDIFDSDDTNSSKAEQMKCSLSDLVRQNKKAFSSSKRERGAATGADDYEQKGLRPFSGKGYKLDDLDIRTRGKSYTAERDDLVMEAEDKGMWSGGGRTAGAGWSMGIKHNQSYNYKAGMGGKGSSGRTLGDDRPRSKGRQHYNREGYSDAESEGGGRYSSGKIYGKEGPRYKESKARGGYSDESGGCGSKTERGGGFERQKK